MKKFTILMMLSLTLLTFGFQQKVFAAMPVPCNAPSAPSYPEYYTTCVQGGSGGSVTNIPANSYYVSFLDQYRMDYGSVTGATNYTLHFVAADQTVYNANYAFAPTGTHYLTCNGIYNLFFYDSNNILIASTPQITTSLIVTPTCNSYADGVNGKNDLGATMTNGKITWTAKPGATTYEIYKDGTKITETPNTEYTPVTSGGYSIVAKDVNGIILGQSDINVAPTPPPTCDVCTKLSEMLRCPDWNAYMGELTNAFRAALPPPPNWDDIANKIGTSVITKLADYVGSVPSAPSQEEINAGLDTSLPNIDGTAPDAESLVPSMPPGYEEAKPFDISSGEQIPIVDESVPFQILDPLHNIQYDAPGVPVLPGSSSNNTGGIETPENIPLPSSMPTQGVPSMPGDTQKIPIPSSIPSSVPVPNGSGGDAPIPSIIP